MINSIFQLRYCVGISCVLALSACEHLKQDAKLVEASYQKSASDTVIYTNVVQILQSIRRDLPSEVRLIVLQGRVLLVGYVATAQEHIDLVNAIWKIKGVQEVIDHLENVPVNEKTGFDIKNTFVKTHLDTMFLTNSALHYGNFQ
ncbi:MAG: BON domain-containing protein, partial [Alphaproteobacteria bacterium]|nr:BON domain-containing protein [Alphaproteobacteria bacterium]